MTKTLSTLIILIIISTGLYAQRSVMDKKIDFSFNDKSLVIAIINLQTDHNLDFEYRKKDIEGLTITKRIPKMPIERALSKFLEGTGLSFQLKEPNIVVLKKGVFSDKPEIGKSKEQPTRFDITVSGIVKDADTGETLPFATIAVAGTTQGSDSNVDGWFTLMNVASDTVLLEVSYLGYQPHLIRLSPSLQSDALVIKLRPEGQMLDEVVLVANKKDQMMKASNGVSKIGLSPAQITAIPSLGEKDIFRSLQLLPGVSGSNESSSGLYVRGGTPDQNLVMFDGFTVYHVDHLFGFFSAFNSNAIKDVQLYKGGFEAKYGGRLSSVVDITGKDGNTEEVNVGAGISLLSANVFAEVPFAKGKGSLLLTGRQSFQSNFYRDLLNFSDGTGDTGTEDDGGSNDNNSGGGFIPGRNVQDAQPDSWFYDLNLKGTYRTKKDIFSISLYNGQDNLDNSRSSNDSRGGGGPFGGGSPFGGSDNGLNFSIDVKDDSDWGNTGSSLKWSRRWNSKIYSNALLSYSNYFSTRDRSTDVIIERDSSITERSNGNNEDNDLKDISFKWDWEWQPAPLHKVSFGTFSSSLDIKYDYIENDTTTVLARDDSGIVAGAYLQSQSTLFKKLIITPGLRMSYFDQTDQAYLEPRLSMQYIINDNFKLKSAVGKFYQYANRIIREDVSQGSRDFWILSDNDNVPVGESDHFILGIGFENEDYVFDIEGYYKKQSNLTEYSTRFDISGVGPNSTLSLQENFFNGSGIAKGIEFLAQKKSGKLNGWISYTIGQVENEFDAFGSDPFAASHDVTNELKIVGTYKSGNWTFGGTFVYATGKPYTAPLGAYSVTLLDGETASHFAVSNKNALRLPEYHRLDLSINYDFDYFLGGSAQAGLSLFNLYGRDNVWYKEFDVVEGSIVETNINLLGFTPSLYFNWKLHK